MALASRNWSLGVVRDLLLGIWDLNLNLCYPQRLRLGFGLHIHSHSFNPMNPLNLLDSPDYFIKMV